MTAAQIARALGGHRSGNQWKCKCPAHADKDPSMIIFDGKIAPQVRCYAGCEPIEIIGALRAMGLWERGEGDTDESEQELRRRESTRADPNRHQALALQIWEHAVDPRETLAETYLRARGLALPSSACVTALRYHPDCPKGNHTVPALVALMRSVLTFEPQAIQRLFLAVDDDAHVFKTEAMMLGPVRDAAMMVSSRGETFRDCMSFCPRLYVCEGLETALALHQAGFRPVWALGSAGAIERLPVIFGVGHLVICADNDNSSIGLQCAIVCAARWNASSHQGATIVMPPASGADFADVLNVLVKEEIDAALA
jgi:hypothetical protein